MKTSLEEGGEPQPGARIYKHKEKKRDPCTL